MMIPEPEAETGKVSGRRLLVQKLPCLEKGINLVRDGSDDPVFQLLLANELTEGEALWIDQEDSASTFCMASLGGEEILSRIRVSRSYTPYQHYTSVMEAENYLDGDVEVLAIPSVNLMYEDGQLREKEREDLFGEMIEKVRRYAERYDLKVITSLSDSPGETEFLVRSAADKTVEVEKTPNGARFETGDFSSTVYRSEDKIQTTLPLFERPALKVEVKSSGKNEQNLQTAPGTVL